MADIKSHQEPGFSTHLGVHLCELVEQELQSMDADYSSDRNFGRFERSVLLQAMNAKDSRYIFISDMDTGTGKYKVSVFENGREVSGALGEEYDKMGRDALKAKERIYAYSDGEIEVSPKLYIIERLPGEIEVLNQETRKKKKCSLGIDKSGKIVVNGERTRGSRLFDSTIISAQALGDLVTFYTVLAHETNILKDIDEGRNKYEQHLNGLYRELRILEALYELEIIKDDQTFQQEEKRINTDIRDTKTVMKIVKMYEETDGELEEIYRYLPMSRTDNDESP